MKKNTGGINRIFFVPNEKGNYFNKPFLLNNVIVLRSLEKGLIRKDAVEAARKAIKMVIKKAAFLIIRCAPYLPITSKPSEVRMGKGKGKVSDYVCPCRPGQILFSIVPVKFDLPTISLAKNALLRAAVKLPVKARCETMRDNFSKKIIKYDSQRDLC